jgi:hypothetical protein
MKIPRKMFTIFSFAFVGWILCFATIGIGMATLPVNSALIVHAITAPIYFIVISSVYFKKFNYTSPLLTALIFTLFIISLDFFLVALVIIKSLAMFESLLGTWIPFTLIFLVTYLTGSISKLKQK